MRYATVFMLALLASLVSLYSAPPTRAQTQTWQQRTFPATPATPKSSGRSTNSVKSQDIAPSRVPTGPLGASGVDAPRSGGDKSLGPSTASGSTTQSQSSDDNAAYEAFDQGKYLTALALAEKAAASGDAISHTLIARIYAEGFGVPKDTATAAKWYARGAELGDIEAAFALGVLYAQGAGVPKNYADAARLFEVAALKGHALANYNLALLFLKGEGKPFNPKRAFGHMRYSAEQGVIAAQYDLGTLYATGEGVEPNAFEAAAWIGKAAVQGHSEAQVDYAVILFKDHELPPEQKLALRKQGFGLLVSAGERGLPIAQNRLAHAFANGLGVEKNVPEAMKWHLIAKSAGVDDEALEGLLRRLSKADREKAQRAADEWRERAVVQ